MRVIARAYGDRPLDREVTGRRGNLIYVAAPSSEGAKGYEFYGVGFPHDAVFAFDQELFDSLQRAWREGRRGDLDAHWRQATPLETAAQIAA